MNAPFRQSKVTTRLAELTHASEVRRIDRFVEVNGGEVFHRPAWIMAVENGTRQTASGLVAEQDGAIVGWLPLNAVRSHLFGNALVSSGFAVGGGVLAISDAVASKLCRIAQDLSGKLDCASLELRGGYLPPDFQHLTESHCGFSRELAATDEAQLQAIPRKQRAEVRRGLARGLRITVGKGSKDRKAHYAVYAESVRNLGTPVFPKSLFNVMLDSELEADILTVWQGETPVASVISFYHRGSVLPYWGGGTKAARALRANDVMYYELMLHARRRGCTRFDFGRSKTGSGGYHFKKNWGFEPGPLKYGVWAAADGAKRNVDPASPRHAARIALWKKLPLPLANLIGPHIARGLG